MCTGGKDDKHDVETYTDANCVGGKSVKNGDFTRGGYECRPKQAIPPQDDVRCTLIGLITGDGEDDTVEKVAVAMTVLKKNKEIGEFLWQKKEN